MVTQRDVQGGRSRLGSVACLLGVLLAAPLAAERPNVLFIAVDDLNDWIGCLGGHPQARTPNIDRLASSATLFTNAHCNAPLCNPSRASVMTGLLPSTSGVHGNQQDWRRSPHVRDKDTLAQHFRRHGYWTGACGKIFHANHGCEAGALNGGHGGLRGFNHPPSWTERFPSKDLQLAPEAVPTGRNLNGLDIWHWDWGPVDVSDAATNDGKSVAWAVEQLAAERDRPFFLAVGIYRPHGPWYVPQEYFDRFDLDDIVLPVLRDDDLEDVPEIARGHARGRNNLHARILRNGLYAEAVRAYLANIAFADAMVGRVLEALENGPHADDTIVCLWSDHGWHLGEKLKWHKSTQWEEATRVPLIIRAPGVTEPGTRCSRVVSLVDLYPTLSELCDLPRPGHLDGTSLAPLLRDPRAEWDRVAITTRAGKHHSVRSESWRYIRYADGSEELYDHRNDPHEFRNLAHLERHAAVKARLARHLPATVRVVSEPSRAHREPGFRPIFNGRDLTSWDGDPEHWRVEDGLIVGRVTPERPLEHATSLIWRGAWPADFELRLEFKITGDTGAAGGGVVYRGRKSEQAARWSLQGYEADLVAQGEKTGALVEEPGRGVLALPGRRVVVATTGKRAVEPLGEGDEVARHARPGEWNELSIRARGERLVHEINGHRIVRVEDHDARRSNTAGWIGLRLDADGPVEIRFRNLRINTYGSVESRPRAPSPFHPQDIDRW